MTIQRFSKFREMALVVSVYFLLTIGQAGYAIKFNVPWFGTNDFSSYHLMAQNPFDNSAENPWHASRVFTPFLAWILFKSNLYLRTDNSPFIESYSIIENTVYDERILFSLITVNYIALFLSSIVLVYVLKSTLINSFVNKILIYSFPLLLFITPATYFSFLTGITEGVSILVVSLLLLQIKNKNYKLFLFLVVLSIFQRELIPLLIFFIVFNLRRDGLGAKWYLTPLLAFFVSIFNIFLRDSSVSSSSLRVDIDRIFQDFTLYNLSTAIVYSNLIVIYLILIFIFNKSKIELKQFVPVLLFFGSLVILHFVLPVGIQNLMRMLSLANPLIILLLVSRLINIRYPGSSKNILLERELTIHK